MKWYILLLVLIVVCMIVTMTCCSCTSQKNDIGIDRYADRTTIDIVISRFQEDLLWLLDGDIQNALRNPELNVRILVYNKGGTAVSHDLLSMLREHFEVNVIVIPNVGREAHTYLYHIIQNFDNLGDVTVFLHGSSNVERKWLKSKYTILKSCATKKSVFPVDHTITNVRQKYATFTVDTYQSRTKENVDINPESSLASSIIRPMGKWYETVFGNVEVAGVCWCAIFSASRDRILQKDIAFYQKLIRFVEGQPNPETAHYFERSWVAVFHPVPKEEIYTGFEYFVPQPEIAARIRTEMGVQL